MAPRGRSRLCAGQMYVGQASRRLPPLSQQLPYRRPPSGPPSNGSRSPASVTVLRGVAAAIDPSSAVLFAPASAPDFERIAEAVHGVESSYGTDPAMWRPDPDGPQGPMQVSAAAA